MFVNPCLKGLETNKHGPEKMCIGNEKGRQEKPRNKKWLEEQFEKSQGRNPKRAKQGESTPDLENLENSEVEEISNFLVLKLFL